MSYDLQNEQQSFPCVILTEFMLYNGNVVETEAEFLSRPMFYAVGRVAQSVQRLAMDWAVRGSNPGGARFSAPVHPGPGVHTASYAMGAGSLPGVKSGRGVMLTPHPLQVSWARKSRAISLLPLWTVRPVQNLSACTVELYLYSPYGLYGLYRTSVPVQVCTITYFYGLGPL